MSWPVPAQYGLVSLDRSAAAQETITPTQSRNRTVATPPTQPRGAAGAPDFSGQTQETLRESEKRLQSILDNTTHVIYAKDVQGRYILINRRFEELFHVRRNEVVGKTDHDFFPAAAADKFRANDLRVLQTMAPLEVEEVAPHDDGDHTYISIKFPLLDSANQAYAVCGISTDITERERIEAELRRHREHLAELVEARTAELSSANERLLREVAERERAQRRLAAFSSLAQRLNSTTTMDEAARRIVAVADELLGWDACVLVECALEEGPIRRVVHIDTIDGRRVEVEPVHSGPEPGPATRRVMREGAQLILRDASSAPLANLVPFGDTRRLSASLMFVPIRNGSRVIGMLSIQSYTPQAYSRDDLETLQALADYCGGAMDGIRAQEALQASETRFRLVARAANDAIWDWDLLTDTVAWNEGVQTLFGYAPDEVDPAVDWWVERIHPDERARVVSGIHKVIDGQDSFWADEYRYRCRDGSYAVVIDRGYVVREEGGRAVRMLGAMLDITARRRAEEEIGLLQSITLAVGEAEDLTAALTVALRKVCDATGWILGQAWVHSADGRSLECSTAWYSRAAGLEAFRNVSERWVFGAGEGLPGRAWSSQRPAWIRDVTEDTNFPRAGVARQVGLRAGMAFPILAGGAVEAVIEFFVFEPREEDARLLELVSGVAAQLGSVIQRKRAEEALRDSETKLRAIIENTTDAIFVKDCSGAYTLMNPAGARLLGLAAEQIIGRRAADLFDPADSRRIEFDDHHVIATGETRTFQEGGVNAGAERVYLSTKFPYRSARGEIIGVIGVSRDITGLKRTEQQLRASEARLRLVTSALPVVLWTVDRELTITLSMGSGLRELGITPAQTLGRNLAEYLTDTPNAAMVVAQHRAALEGRPMTYDSDFRDRTFVVSLAPLYDGGPQPSGAVGVAFDITERKLMEQRLRHTQKMAAIGLLAAGVAHDFNNMLTVISGSCHSLRKRLRGRDERQALLDRIVNTSDRAAQLVSQLLMFSRQRAPAPQRLDLRQLLVGMTDMLRGLAGPGVDVRLETPPHVCAVRADRSYVERVLVNLTANARDAMPGGGMISIVLADEVVEPDGRAAHGIPAGRYVRLTIQDTGEGLSPAAQEHLFEPFCTTKPVGQGTGLGLALVHSIVEQTGGHITYETSPGEGTTFNIYLPAFDDGES